MAAELSCQELVELVTAYLENALSDAERARVEAHLASCDGCENYIAQMEQTIATLGVLRAQDVTPDAQAALLHLFRDWRAGND